MEVVRYHNQVDFLEVSCDEEGLRRLCLIMLGGCQPRMPQLQWLPRVDAPHERCWRTFLGGFRPREGGQGGQGGQGVQGGQG